MPLMQSYYIFLDYARKILKHLHILHIFYTFEHLPWLYPPHNHIPIKANSLEATFAKC